MSIYDTLNNEQKQAVMHTEGPLLLLAGAGSGKTRVLTHRIAYLIENNGVNPWNILAITFTNKAAGEMRERVDNLIGFGSEQIWVSTFHSTCVRILRRYIDLLGFETSFTIYDTDDQKSVVKDIIKRLQLDSKMFKERSVLSAISAAKDELISPAEYKKDAWGDYKREKIADIYEGYQEALKKNNALDFDDLICKTIELFEKHPQVLENYQERFRYIMVDEYQDTNTAQFRLIYLLAKKYKNLCVVGDDDQSIYKFRGANISNILDYEKYFPEAKVIKLEQNYRSTQNILDAANAVIAHNTERKDKALWTEKKEGSKIHFRPFDTAYEEAEYIAYDIIQGQRKEGLSYGQNAILYRTNAQSRLLEEQLVKTGVPYNIVGGTNFYARREIKDLLSYLKTIDNGLDDLAVKRIINVPKRGIGNATIQKVQDYADERGLAFYDALLEAQIIPSLGKTASKLAPFVNMMQVFRSKKDIYGLKELLEDIIETIGYEKYLEENDQEDYEDRIENVNELISKMASYEEINEEATLSSFLEEVALVADIDELEDDGNKVLLMTLHSAKGLEFDRVYLAGMEDGLFPSYMSIMDEDTGAIEEERRLAYVGITRAREELTITCARARMLRGETNYNPVSRFLREIPESLLDNRPLKNKREYENYEENSIEHGNFKAKPFSRTQSVNFLGDGLGATRSSNMTFAKPKAVVKPKVTALENKPFIAKGIDSLNSLHKGMPTGDTLSYGVGDRVSHIKYGVGIVKDIVKGPKDYQVTVEFDSAGQKIMYAAFAKLKKI